MECRLGTIDISDNQQIKTFDGIISKEEFQKIETNIKVLEEFSNTQELYSIIQINFLELSNYFQLAVNDLVSKQVYVLDDSRNDFKIIYRNSNRLLLNLLSSGRTLIDHLETYLKRKYGKDTEEIIAFKSYLNNTFDNYFAYRFTYKLRNFAQHCALPISSINYSVSNEGGESPYQRKAILNAVFIKKNLLEKYSEWGSQVKADLMNKDEMFSVMPIVADYYKCISEIFDYYVDIDKPSLKRVAQNLDYIIKMFPISNPNIQICAFSNFVYSNLNNYENSTFEVITLPTELINSLKKL